MDTEASDVEISSKRLDELMRWHGKDESTLPPAHTLQNLSRDTIAALRQLQQCRGTIECLRTALGRAFWAQSSSELRITLLEALGPPPAPQDEDETFTWSSSSSPHRAD
ncbi:MAG TPA: hypothetical protein VMG11_03350 [Steroidobacteraceae bacterium]|nr:hypothetical protein [Steroidobacteraceae bacterium]